MIIREKHSSHLDYSNYSMLNKSALAVAESIKRYVLPIESLSFVNNGLRAKECNMLLDALERHAPKL
jgi:hypothetical protein